MTMRTYSTAQTIISFILISIIILSIFPAIMLIGAGIDEHMLDAYDYRDLYTIEVVDHSIEKIEDNLYEITLSMKNDSAYAAELYGYDISAEIGDKVFNNICVEAFETSIGYHVQSIIIPAGRTTDAHFRIPIQNPVCSITFKYRYSGVGYHEIFGDDDRKYYLVEVDLT